jgi:hypothetical protein
VLCAFVNIADDSSKAAVIANKRKMNRHKLPFNPLRTSTLMNHPSARKF